MWPGFASESMAHRTIVPRMLTGIVYNVTHTKKRHAIFSTIAIKLT